MRRFSENERQRRELDVLLETIDSQQKAKEQEVEEERRRLQQREEKRRVPSWGALPKGFLKTICLCLLYIFL